MARGSFRAPIHLSNKTLLTSKWSNGDREHCESMGR